MAPRPPEGPAEPPRRRRPGSVWTAYSSKVPGKPGEPAPLASPRSPWTAQPRTASENAVGGWPDSRPALPPTAVPTVGASRDSRKFLEVAIALVVIAIVAVGPGLAIAVGSVRVFDLPPLTGLEGAVMVAVAGAVTALLAVVAAIVATVMNVRRTLPALTLLAAVLLVPIAAYGGVSFGVMSARDQALEDAQRLIGNASNADLDTLGQEVAERLDRYGIDLDDYIDVPTLRESTS
jgi:hypothetical protein